MGPWVTTKNDVSDPQKLKVQSHVNGEPRQNGNTSDMVFSVAQLVAYISRFVTLNIGDIILTGTPAGVGMGFEPPRFLEEGDVITCSIAELGSISNQIVGNQ
jgi:2-keto-4-pentenoate hydratase/2-oxohepta-3-ene-1,7-dioic acid hydratase in catechol pathway